MEWLTELCVLNAKDWSVWHKNWKTQKNSWKFVRPKKIAEILQNPEKQLKNLPKQKNRIWPNFKPKKVGRASLSKFWYVSPWASMTLLPNSNLILSLKCWVWMAFLNSGQKQNFLEKTGLRSVSIKGRFTNRFFRLLDSFSLPPTTYPLSRASTHQNRFF